MQHLPITAAHLQLSFRYMGLDLFLVIIAPVWHTGCEYYQQRPLMCARCTEGTKFLWDSWKHNCSTREDNYPTWSWNYWKRWNVLEMFKISVNYFCFFFKFWSHIFYFSFHLPSYVSVNLSWVHLFCSRQVFFAQKLNHNLFEIHTSVPS